MTPRHCLLRAAAPLLIIIALATTATAEETPKWEELTREQGIVVHEKEIPGRDLPAFRGRGIVNASVFDILAVLSDTPRLPEWMHNCAEAKLIQQVSEFERVTYNRTDAPWPVDDRDVVVRAKVTIDAKRKRVIIKFRSFPNKAVPVPDGVVRMPKLHGHYILKIIDTNKTHVEYMVEADPGGMLPAWLASQASEDLPLHTLKGLRKQVKKTKGTYPDFVKRWDPEQGGQLPKEIMK